MRNASRSTSCSSAPPAASCPSCAGSRIRSENARSSAGSSFEVFKTQRKEASGGEVPGPGDAVSRRHRIRGRGRSVRGHQESPQRRGTAEVSGVRARRAAPPPVQGRGPARRWRARARRRVHPPPAVSGARARGALPRTRGARPLGYPQGSRCHRGGRDKGRRFLSEGVAVVRRPAAGPVGRRDGGRAHLSTGRSRFAPSSRRME